MSTVNGVHNDVGIANEFAKYFASVYYSSDVVSDAVSDFNALQSQLKLELTHNINVDCLINVESVDKCIHELKLGKASGPDGLSAEHLLHAHPYLVVLLIAMFRGMVCHGYVPEAFGNGIIIPLVKNKMEDLSSVGNYRAITLIPIISKLFECIILKICSDHLETDELQFGFKQGVGCANALFAMRTSIDFYVDRGSTVFTAALDISKAYDTVNHYKLYSSLLRFGCPMWVVNILVDWYSKLAVVVRWNGSMSQSFAVRSGVRQGSSLSPSLFNIFVNKFIVDSRAAGLGICINKSWLGCIMYADDIILLSASIVGLQALLDKCGDVSSQLGLSFNCSKSWCLAVGPRCKASLPDMFLCHKKLCGLSRLNIWELPFVRAAN